MTKRISPYTRQIDLLDRIAELEDEVEDLYVQYFETLDPNDFDNPKGMRGALRRVSDRITEMREELSQI